MNRLRSVPELIRERRLAMGMSLGQLAARVGKTAASVRSWERGDEPLDADLRVRLAEALELDPDDLVAAPTGPADGPGAEPAAGPGGGIVAPEPEPAVGAEAEAEQGAAVPAAPAVTDRAEVAPPVASVPAGPAVTEPDPAAATPDVLAPADPLDTSEDSTAVEGRPVPAAVPVPAAPTYEADAVAVVQPEPLDAVVDLLDAPTEAIPMEQMEREAQRVQASQRTMPVGTVVVPYYMDDPRERRRYWIRTGLTAVALIILGIAVLWSAGHLSEAIGRVLDQFGSSVQ